MADGFPIRFERRSGGSPGAKSAADSGEDPSATDRSAAEPSAAEPSAQPKESGASKASNLIRGSQQTSLMEEEDLPPVVARMVVEIRSDGSRTIARGAMEDKNTGESVSIYADASSPIALVRELSKAILTTPALAKEAVASLLPQILKRNSKK